MYRLSILFLLLVTPFLACADQGQLADLPEEGEVSAEAITGRWDVTVETESDGYPSWFEITQENGRLAGQFVGRVGSARPIEQISFENGTLTFSLEPQYEDYDTDMSFSGEFVDNQLKGTTNAPDGGTLSWTAVRAPELAPPDNVQWGEPIQLFNDQNLEGWKLRDPDAAQTWEAQNGVLVNTASGTDLITEDEFESFRLQMDFRYPEGSNSGVYLRGRYELQIQDDIGKEPGSLFIGGVYGFLTPTVNAARPAGEWQNYDITLLGRQITVILNGQTVIDNQEIPGITGGALDPHEAEAGPIMLQGDHGPVSFRNIVLTPAQ
ncbi:MAG: 3-keto-disaccharide hydrolase [Acidobacteriota bacterium]